MDDVKKFKEFLNEDMDWGYGRQDEDDVNDQIIGSDISNYDKYSNEKFDYLYHSIEKEDIDSVMRYGLKGEIYLTLTQAEAKKYHPIVLKIDVSTRQLKVSREGFIVKDIPVDQIEML
jgi:hypothetical protein